MVAYCMVRHFSRNDHRSRQRFSSLLLPSCHKDNNGVSSASNPFLKNFSSSFRGLHSLIEKKGKTWTCFFHNRPGDVLFIDSSHTVKLAGRQLSILGSPPRLNQVSLCMCMIFSFRSITGAIG